MSLPATDNFVGTDGDPIPGRVTTTGALTWVSSGGTNTWVINTNRAFGGAGGGICLLNAGVADVNCGYVIPNISIPGILVFRSNSGATVNLQVWPEATRVRLFQEDLTLLGTFTGTLVNSDEIGVLAIGASVTVTLNGTALTGLTGITTSHGLTNTYVGIRSASGDLVKDFFVAAGVAALPTATVSIPARLGNTFAGTSGTSGTGPYTFQWQRSTVPNSGFANLANGSGVTGATTLTMVDGSSAALAATTAQTALYYRLVVTDSLTATFNSNVIASVPGTHAMPSLWIWDSIGVGFGTAGPGPNWLLFAPIIFGARAVSLTNTSEGGAATPHWYDSAGSGVQTALVDASAAGITAGQTIAEIRLGINDASSGRVASVYAANLLGMANYLIGQGYSKVIIHYPTGIQDATIMALMKTYLPAIDALENGTTIRVGDRASFVFFSEFATTYLQAEGTHQNDAGLVPLAILTALGTATALGDVPSSGGGVSGARIYGGF